MRCDNAWCTATAGQRCPRAGRRSFRRAPRLGADQRRRAQRRLGQRLRHRDAVALAPLDHGLLRRTTRRGDAASLHQGVATGARGPAIAELEITQATAGAVAGNVELTREQRDALLAGHLYIQLHAARGVAPDNAVLWGWLLRARTAPCAALSTEKGTTMSSILRSRLFLLLLPSPVPGPFAFTPEQAAAGRAAYEQLCHLPRREPAPAAGRAARGPRSSSAWGEPRDERADRARRATMPPDNPGGLPEETYVGIVAYLLQSTAARRARSRSTATHARRASAQGLTASRRRSGAGARRAHRPRRRASPSPAPCQNFVPVTDAMLRNPAAGRLADAAARLQRHELQPARRRSRPTTSIGCSSPGCGRCATAARISRPARLQRHDVSRQHRRHRAGARRAHGQLIWEHHVGADVAPRGLALYGNMLIFHSAGEWAVSPQDAWLVALDARPARPSGTSQMPDVYASNSGPLVANGLLIQGMGTCTVYEENKCFISAYDPATGEQRWRFRTIALGGEPGGDTWGDLPDLYRAGGETWITGSYDPELNLTYWGTTQAKPWMPASRGMRTHDVGALHELHAGARREHRASSRGTTRTRPAKRSISTSCSSACSSMPATSKWVFSVGKDGVLWKNDRQTGAYIGHVETVFQNVWASFDPKTGTPRYRPDILEHKVGEWVDACPSTAGGKNWHAMSFHAPSRQLIIPLEPELHVAARAGDRAGAGRRQRRRRRPALLRDARHERQRRQARRVQRGHARSRPGRSSSARRS